MIPAPAFLSNPERFMAFSRWAAPMFGAIALVLAMAGLWLGFTAPEDYQQGDTVRIMFIHVPAAWMSMFVYVCLAGASFLSLVFRHALALPHGERPTLGQAASMIDAAIEAADRYYPAFEFLTKGGRKPEYQEADGQRVMKQQEIVVRVQLGRGNAKTTLWTCDLSHDYVSINADYRS